MSNIIRNKFLFFDSVESFETRLAAGDILESSIAFVCETTGSGNDTVITPKFIWAQGQRWETNYDFNPSTEIGSGSESGQSTNTSVSVSTTNGVVTSVGVTDLYTADSNAHYISPAHSLKEADSLLDAALYNLEGTVADNTILDGDVIDATKTPGTGTTLEVKVDETTIDKEYISGNSGLKRLKSVVQVGWDATNKKIVLKDKNGNILANGGEVPLSTMLGSGIITNNTYNETTGILTITFQGGATADINLLKLIDINDASVYAGSENYLEVHLDASAGENSGAQFQIEALTVDPADAYAAEGQNPAHTGLADALEVKEYVDDAISTLTSDSLKKVNGDSYVSVSAPSSREQTITTNISTLSRNTTTNRLTGGTANHLVDAANLQTQVNAVIDNLDKASTSISSTTMSTTPTSPGFVKLTYSEDGGIVNVDGLEIKIGDLDTETEGLATVSDVVQYVDDITGGANQWKAGTGTNTAILKGTTAGNGSTGNNSIVGGTSPTISGSNSIVSGTSSNVAGNNSIAVGNALSVANDNEAAFGYYNSSLVGTGLTQDEIDQGTTVFTVGIGSSSLSPRNAFDVRRNGDILILYSGNVASTLQTLLHNEIDWYIDNPS